MSTKDTALENPRKDGEATQREHTASPVDRSVLAQISEGDRAIEIRMLSSFCKSNIVDAAALRDAIDRQDIVAVAQVSHRLLGAGKVAGAVALANICEAIEHAARDRNWTGVMENSNACYGELDRVKAYLSSIVVI